MKFSSAIGALAALVTIADAAPAQSTVEARALPLVQSVSHFVSIHWLMINLTIILRINCVESFSDPNFSRKARPSRTLHTPGPVAIA